MDENQMQQNTSGDETELSKSIDEHSFIGKMKFGVSKILPNSLSKWLSPKVDGNNGRRRRHEEIDSDESDIIRNTSLMATDTQQSTSVMRKNDLHHSQIPPSKKQKTTPCVFSNQNNFDSYSSAMASRGERNSIVSSTLIEDVIPQRTNNQLNRVLSLENGQHALLRDENELDEGSSSQSRDKSNNPFTLNNDSSVVNFSAHLQRAKSLFNNRSYVNQRLKNYRMRNPRSALHRSTSSLCDNNSVSSNASSAMSSPFYNGQTTFGGASATSRRLNAALQTDYQMYHRPKIPTNLVASRSTSSLNNLNGTASMSTTTKRILDVMSKYSTPLTEVRRISNALPSISETSMLSKRKSLLETDSTFLTEESDKTKRILLKPNTPYNRPYGRNPVDSVLTTELHVPSMPELLQLKKFAASTIEIREIANKSDSALNKPLSTNTSMQSTRKLINSGQSDVDASNNNEKFVNKNSNDNAITTMKEHKNKIRNSFIKRKMGKGENDDVMPEPVILPNVTLEMNDKVQIKFPEPIIPETKKITSSNDSEVAVPFKSKDLNTVSLDSNANSFQMKATNERQINGNRFDTLNKMDSLPTAPSILMKVATPSSCSTTLNSDLGFGSQKTQSSFGLSNKSIPSYHFSDPIIIATSPNLVAKSIHSIQYKFSEPIFIDSKEKKSKTEVTSPAFGAFKFETKPVSGITSDSGIVDTTQSFGSTANKSTGLFGSSSTFPSGKNLGTPDFAKIISSAPTQPSPCDNFKTITTQKQKDKWECPTCLVSNEASVSKCVCCQTENKKSDTFVSKPEEQKTKTKVDDGFKALITQQTQGKWECDACMTRNDESMNKCVSCETPRPNAKDSIKLGESKTLNAPQKTFSFGNLSTNVSSTPMTSSTLMDDSFKSLVSKQKSSKWECKVCTAQNDLSASKCVCCNESKDSISSEKDSNGSSIKPTTSQFSFGNVSELNKNVSGGFSFGFKSNTSPAKKSESISFTTNSSLGQFSFGSSSKSSETSTTAVAKTSQTQESSGQFSFGSSVTSADKGKTIQASDNDIFKKIIVEQNSKWECKECMIKNESSAQKCVACETPKPGNISEKNSNKEMQPTLKPTFSFGTSVANNKTFSFGSKPGNNEEKPTTQTSLFGSTSFNKSSSAFQFGSSNSTTSSPFALSSTNSAFSVAANKSTTEGNGATANSVGDKTSVGSFSFGAQTTNSLKTDSSTSSKDVTDCGSTSLSGSLKTNVANNIESQNPANGPATDAIKTSYSLGSSDTRTPQENEIKISNNPISDDKSKFIFGKPESITSSPFGTMKPESITASPFGTMNTNSAISSSPFIFNSGTPAIPFSAPQPTFSTPSFSFGANSTTPSSTSTQSIGSTNQPVFGSNCSATTSLPTANAFAPNNAFSSTNQTFNTTSQLTSSDQNVQLNMGVQSTPGLFQFGASNNNSSPFPDVPKLGGFNFTPNSTPSFNFSQSQPSTNQPNLPFTFGTASEPQQNLFSVQSSSTAAAIQQRRKLRPVRRVNRP